MDIDQFRGLFSDSLRLQRYLDVEAALAQAQANLGIIPQEAARRIAEVAHVELLDLERVNQEIARTGHSFAPLVVELARVAGGTAGGWVHWGATTQNIQQTGDIIGLRLAETEIVRRLRNVVWLLTQLADEHADTAMAGRTHQQHAVPITFGFKVATWIDILVRDLQRFEQSRPRLLMAMAGGAAGTFATLGAIGPAVQEEFARLLGLRSMMVPSRSMVDHLVEFVCVIGITASTIASISEECARLTSSEFGELAETLPDDNVGSSTMPQKRNPKFANEATIASARVRAMVPLALETMIQSHEVDGSRSAMLDHALREACMQMFDAVSALQDLLAGLQVFPERMRANLDLTDGLISAEAVMMSLGEELGRQEAHALIHEIALEARKQGNSFLDLLLADDRVFVHLTQDQMQWLLDPTNYLGLSAEIARAASHHAREYLASSDQQ